MHFYPHTSDWHLFYAVAKGLPYTKAYHNPLWTDWLLYPFGLLTSLQAYSLFMSLTMVATVLISYKYAGTYLPAILALTSPPFLRLIIHGQIEGFILLGLFSTSMWASPLFLLVKPQSAFLAIAGMPKRFWITGIIFAFIAYLTIDLDNINTINQNVSIFPYGLIIGIPCLICSIVRKDPLWGAIATPFISPYIITHSLFVPLFALFIKKRRWSILIWSIVWWIFI